MTWLRRLSDSLLGRRAAPVPAAEEAPRPLPGVNLVGYARGGLGLGETLRRFAEALAEAGLPFSVVDVDVNLGERGRDARLEHWIGAENPHPVNLLFVNADQVAAVREHLGAAFFAGRRNVGYWFWELEGFPQAWHGAFSLVDEVWTATRFVQRSIGAHSPRPVRIVPHPVVVPPVVARPREALGVPGEPYLFLFTFDFHSYLARKNPEGAIEAFRRAFPAGDRRAALVLKSINGARAPEALAALRARIGDDPRIVQIDEFLPSDVAMSLVAACDAYVSLHRAEGFGQGLAEAMYLGMPVIATAYSGNLDFMDETNSALVPARMVPIAPGEYPYGDGQSWADPDLDAAAALMRRMVESPVWAAELGRVAARSIRASNGAAACVAAMREHLRATP